MEQTFRLNWRVLAPLVLTAVVVGSALGYLLHRDPNTYRYIPESIRTYPGAEGVARMMEQNGLTDVRTVRVLGGLMAIHVATAPARVPAPA